MPTRSPIEKTPAAKKREAGPARAPQEVQAAIGRSIESRQEDQDAAQRLAGLLGNDSVSRSYRHTPLPSRLHHELSKWLEGPKHVETDLIRSKLGIYLELAKAKLKLPVKRTFYPRDEVSVGGQGYEEEFFKRETFSARETGLVAATGFGRFSPDTGQFQMVAVSMGTRSSIWLGPTVQVDTDTPTDLLVTANVLLEHQFTLSATRNAPPSTNTAGFADSEIYLRALVTARDKTTLAPLPTPELLPWKPLNMVSLVPGLGGPGYTTPGGRHISPGTSWQGGSSTVHIAFDPDGPLPPNARCDITVTCLIISDAAGAKGEANYGYACVADTRAFGKFSSIELLLFS